MTIFVVAERDSNDWFEGYFGRGRNRSPYVLRRGRRRRFRGLGWYYRRLGLSGTKASGLVLSGSAHVTLEYEIDVMKETSIRFDAVFGVVVVGEVPYAPFKGCERVVTLDGVGLEAGFVHECTVVLAGLRPCFGNMVGVELVVAFAVTRGTNNDAFVVFTSLSDEIHGATKGFDAVYGRKIAHALGGWRAGEHPEAAIHAASCRQ